MIIRLLRLSGLNKIPVHEENKLRIYYRGNKMADYLESVVSEGEKALIYNDAVIL